MATAQYFISGIWSSKGAITDVFLHQVSDKEGSFNAGVKTSENAVIMLIEKGVIIKSLIWNYSEATFKIGAPIIVVIDKGRKYLRTKGDATVRDNLDNLLDMRFAF